MARSPLSLSTTLPPQLLLLLILLLSPFPQLTTAAPSPQKAGGKYPGDVCQISSGGLGVCRELNNCDQVRADLKKNKPPTVCSYQGFTPIVCCPANGTASRMCQEYGKAVYVKERAPVLVAGSHTVNTCAIQGVPFIVGGVKAIPNEFPHMALLGYGSDAKRKQWACGGSLISNRFVMTAGHCLDGQLGPVKWARLGELDWSRTDEGKNRDTDYAVQERIAHPGWNPPAHYDDIGLLRLERKVDFTASVRPACLHLLSTLEEPEAIATGWGYTDWASYEVSEALMKVKLPVQTAAACQRAYRTTIQTTKRLTKGITDDSMVCAGDLKGGKDTCRGDSGGPLQVKLSTPYCMYAVAGITSFGKTACGDPDSPAVYTRVAHYVPWIESIVWPEGS